MLLVPIRTECSVRHTPLVNVGLICANVAVFFVFELAGSKTGRGFGDHLLVLDGQSPRLYQLITYQFAHADTWHLLGNMLFLWVFGNGVNAKMGDWPYLLFYIASGMFAGVMFGWQSHHSLLGASGSIAAVTTAYLVLFPRSRVTVLYMLFFIGFIEIPAFAMIGLKIVLWDNIVAPKIGNGGGDIAYGAHLAGYVFGFVVTLAMLLIKAVPRDQYDMLALAKRWNQRRAFAAAMADPQAQAQARYGKVARVASLSATDREKWERRIDERSELRAKIADRIEADDMPAAMASYEALISGDADQCLPSQQQLAIGRAYYAGQRYPQAAAAFERYLACYATGTEANEVRLLLGIINARDLKQFETARKYLKSALDRATSPTRREQAQRWLDELDGATGAKPTV